MTEDRYQQLLESMLEGVYYVNRQRHIQYWNQAAENITGYQRTEVIGHSCAENILQHIDQEGNQLCFSGCPLAATLDDGKPRYTQVYLHHKQGHRVPIDIQVSPVYDQNGQIVGALEVFNAYSKRTHTEEEMQALRQKILQLSPHAVEIEKELAALWQEAYRDALTGIPNRRYGEQILTKHLALLRQHNLPFGLIFFDIDHFKNFNDQYGHSVGDQVLRAVSQSVLNILRRSDTFCRWGGEEFFILAPNVGAQSLLRLAERGRIFIEQSFLIINDHKVSITASFGATLATPQDSPTSLLERADALMYQSKQNGRNQITFA
jgi:diguanylate cyclase (GGDEF)-like protein/PAS domain S-box-containing protein